TGIRRGNSNHGHQRLIGGKGCPRGQPRSSALHRQAKSLRQTDRAAAPKTDDSIDLVLVSEHGSFSHLKVEHMWLHALIACNKPLFQHLLKRDDTPITAQSLR